MGQDCPIQLVRLGIDQQFGSIMLINLNINGNSKSSNWRFDLWNYELVNMAKQVRIFWPDPTLSKKYLTHSIFFYPKQK